MTLDSLNAICMGLLGTEVRYPFGAETRTWCLSKKMYAWCVIGKEPLEVQLKAESALIPHLTASYAFIRPGYHMNKRHWITVDVSHRPDEMLKQLLEDAHALVVTGLPQRERLKYLGD